MMAMKRSTRASTYRLVASVLALTLVTTAMAVARTSKERSTVEEAFKPEVDKLELRTPLGFSADRLERISTLTQSYVDSEAVPGAVLLVLRHGKVAYQRAFGWA